MDVANEPILRQASELVGDPDAIRLLAELVAIAPTNLEDPARGRWEKPHYARAAERIVRAARGFGLATRVYDPVGDPDVSEEFHGGPRPNVVVDLDRELSRRVLVLAHYDVVPVPDEQLARWKTPPHVLSARADGRLYGRGANDDLGSGIVASLVAMRKLAARDDLQWNVRLVACCDEETGGAGGIEAIKAHDDRLAPNAPERILLADAALVPDGDPHTSAASSGVAFGDGSFPRPAPLGEILAFGRALIDLNQMARRWKSRYPSPDWPDYDAPEAVVTGRATVTRFDLRAHATDPGRVQLAQVRAETDASNQVAQAVSLTFRGPAPEVKALAEWFGTAVAAPFRWEAGGRSSLVLSSGETAYQVVGKSIHAGYPHRGHNPVPETLRLLAEASHRGKIGATERAVATFGLDLRLPPEMPLEEAVREAELVVTRWRADHQSAAQLNFPSDRCRGGYALPLDHPLVTTVDRLLVAAFGRAGVFGEYGGTDASSLVGVRTPSGVQIPAVVFGSMDRAARIHEAEESVDPRLLRGVIETLERFATEPGP